MPAVDALDFAPFARINPCGMAGLAVTSLRELGMAWSVEEAGQRLAARLQQRLLADEAIAGPATTGQPA